MSKSKRHPLRSHRKPLKAILRQRWTNSTPKEEKATGKPAELSEKTEEKPTASAKDVKKLLLLLAKATPSHKDDVKALMNSFSADNFKAFEQLAKERDDGDKMMQEAYDKAKALVEKYGIGEAA